MNNVPNFRRGLTAEEIGYLVGVSPTLLEIGSHEGSDTAKFLRAMPEAQIFCFEPELRAILRFNDLLGSDPRVTLCEKAVADVDTPRMFYASTGKAGGRADWDFSGSLCRPTGHYTRSPKIRFKDPALVPCVRLDTWFAEHLVTIGCSIDFCWADVQGSQRLLIAGGRETLVNIRYLYIEAHDPIAYAGEPTQEELIEELAFAFTPTALYARENILFRNKGEK